GRYAAMPWMFGAALFTAAGTTTFLNLFCDDPFLAAAPRATVRTVSRQPSAEFAIPFSADTVRVSPDGRFVALGSEDEEERITFHVGVAGRALQEFDADEAIFVDDRMLLLMINGADQITLRALALGASSAVVWEQSVLRL